ncbi:MAG: hypothetical protein ACI9N1_002289 [Flavobacteriales bacterium]|jgi:hypothetical protein
MIKYIELNSIDQRQAEGMNLALFSDKVAGK